MSCSTILKRLEGKVAIVTGGAHGIGASVVQFFAEQGAKVVIADIQDELGHSIIKKLGSSGDKVISYVHCDVSDEEQIISLVDTTVSKFGCLDIMFNNAGVMNQVPFQSILSTDKIELENMVKVNLIGGFLGAKHAARVMVPNKKGCILFTGSCCTEIAGIATHSYAASKYGIVGLSKSLATELGSHGIRVNCISPFAVLTNPNIDEALYESVMGGVGNLKGRILKAEDIAKAAVYLASDEASYVSGINLVVDGGYSLVNPTMINALTMM